MDGFGAINWWGFTPALDLQLKVGQKGSSPGCESEPVAAGDDLNVLLIGAGDCRHIIKTMAHTYRHPFRKINFFVTESSLELYARHILFLKLVLEPQQRLGLQEKAEMFLELFANSLVRQQSMEYVQQLSTEFIKMVTNFDYLEKKFPLVDMSSLKFKERDMLEGILKFWRNPKTAEFDIAKCWDLRLRQYLGVRYDAIPNVFDWDFHMKLAERGAAIIGVRNYNKWRHKGIAYEIREGTYDTPNRTLASGMVFKHEGERYPRRGYWGDIIVSPYITFGIESEEESFFQKCNNIFMKSSEDVAEYNMLSLLHEIAHRTKYQLPADKDGATASTITEVTEEDEEESSATDIAHNTGSGDTGTDVNAEMLSTDYAKVYLLPLNATPELISKSKFRQLFNVVYISNSHAHVFTKELADATFADGATVIMDTAKFMLELTEEQIVEYVKKIVSIAESAGCKLAGSADEKDDTFVKFTYVRPQVRADS